MKRLVLVLFILVAIMITARSPLNAYVIYSQPPEYPNGGFVGSQYDENVINFIAYDNFTLQSASAVTDVHWQGVFTQPAEHGTIESFSIKFLSDNAGQPGNLLSWQTISGNANEAFVGIGQGGQALVYDYSVDLIAPFHAMGGTQYWLSIVANMPFPPQWGFLSGTGGDGISYSMVMGTLNQWPLDLAFELTSVPEPSTVLLLGAGLAGVGLLRRRFKN